MVAQGNRNGKCGGHGVHRGEHIGHPHCRVAIHLNVAVHVVGGFFAILVHALKSIEHSGHHHERRHLGVIQDFVMKFPGPGCAMNGELHRDHLRLPVKAAQNAGMAVLNEGPNRLGGVDDLEGIQR